MSNINEVVKDNIKVEVDRKPSVLPLPPAPLVVRQEAGRIILFIRDKRIDMNTVTAHKIGLALGTAMLAPDEMIVLIINGERVELITPLNLKLSAALLRKADAADDYQLERKRKIL